MSKEKSKKKFYRKLYVRMLADAKLGEGPNVGVEFLLARIAVIRKEAAALAERIWRRLHED